MQGSFSQVRNRIIADILFRCGIIEKMGTGVRRIKNAYAGYGVEPSFQVMENSIRVILPKIKADAFSEKSASYIANLNPEQEKALNFIRSSQGVNRMELEEYMGIRKTKATKVLNDLLGMGAVIKVGSGRDTRYKANSETRM
jgi:ATP-dependent DNA helicase RecG